MPDREPVEKPYLAHCHHKECSGTLMSFETEDGSKKWGKDHEIIFGDGHKARYAMKGYIP